MIALIRNSFTSSLCVIACLLTTAITESISICASAITVVIAIRIVMYTAKIIV